MSIITLLTDFGSQDGYTAAMIGYLLSKAPDKQIIEASHTVEAQNVWQGALALSRYAKHFPAGTIHMVVVDPGVGSERKALAIKCDDHWLIGPNNGVLSIAAGQYKDKQVYALDSENDYWQKHSSFDGLALFSPAAAYIAKGLPIENVSTPLDDLHHLVLPDPSVINGKIIGQVIAFDHFGNAITNIQSSNLRHAEHYTAVCHGNPFPFSNHYCAAPAHGRLSLLNSDSLLELAIYQSSLRQEMGIHVGDTVEIHIDE